MPELGAMVSVFAGLEGYLRHASLWSESMWSPIAGVSNLSSVYSVQAAKIAEGALGRRDQLAEINSAAPAQLGTTLTYGMVAAGTATFWNPSDLATAEFVMKPLDQAGGGVGATSASASWQSQRDSAPTQDIRTRRGTSPATRLINGTTD